MYKLFSFVWFLFGALACQSATGQVKNISPQEVQTKINSGVLLIDVRTPAEWQHEGMVKGAKGLPLQQLSEALLPKDKNKPIIFICAVGGRSASAASQAVRWGYKNVMNAQGGMVAWKGAGLPTVK